MQVTTSAGPPVCFAKEWDKDAAECAGGRDAGYTNPRTGLNIRDKCSFFDSCGARTQAGRIAQTVIPAGHLVRPGIVTPPTSMGDYLRKQAADNVAEQQRTRAFGWQTHVPQVPVAQTPQGPVPQYAVQNPGRLYHLNYEMPGYLSVPEERMPGESLQQVLLREVIRSVLKAMGHAISHFFDARRIKEKT